MVLGVDTSVQTVPGLDLRSRAIITGKDGTRKYFRVAGLSPGSNLTVFNNTLRNLTVGVQKRMLRSNQNGQWLPPVRSEPGLIMRDLTPFRNAVLRRMTPSIRSTPRDVAMSYKGGRQKVLLRAAESLEVDDFRVMDANVKAFIKYEKGKPDGVPRIICPRSDRYLVHLASWLKPLEGKICNAVNRVWGSTTIAKGLNAQQVGDLFLKKWRSKNDPCCVSLDAERFDEHVGPGALEAEHSVYNGHFKDRELATALRCQLRNECLGVAADGTVKFRVDGGRMSGDINTSMGNCYLMCGLGKVYCEESGVRSADLINNGDDCAFIMERAELHLFLEGLDAWFRRRGFVMVAENPVYELEDIEFCQGHPVMMDHDTCLMVRNIKTALQKDTMCLMPVNKPMDYYHWVRAIGDAGCAMAGDVPVIGAFYKYFASAQPTGRCKHVERKQSTGLFYHSKGMHRNGLRTSDIARVSFWRAFGILPHVQVELEKCIVQLGTVDVNARPLTDFHVPLHEKLSLILDFC